MKIRRTTAGDLDVMSAMLEKLVLADRRTTPAHTDLCSAALPQQSTELTLQSRDDSGSVLEFHFRILAVDWQSVRHAGRLGDIGTHVSPDARAYRRRHRAIHGTAQAAIGVGLAKLGLSRGRAIRWRSLTTSGWASRTSGTRRTPRQSLHSVRESTNKQSCRHSLCSAGPPGHSGWLMWNAVTRQRPSRLLLQGAR